MAVLEDIRLGPLGRSPGRLGSSPEGGWRGGRRAGPGVPMRCARLSRVDPKTRWPGAGGSSRPRWDCRSPLQERQVVVEGPLGIRLGEDGGHHFLNSASWRMVFSSRSTSRARVVGDAAQGPGARLEDAGYRTVLQDAGQDGDPFGPGEVQKQASMASKRRGLGALEPGRRPSKPMTAEGPRPSRPGRRPAGALVLPVQMVQGALKSSGFDAIRPSMPIGQGAAGLEDMRASGFPRAWMSSWMKG